MEWIGAAFLLLVCAAIWTLMAIRLWREEERQEQLRERIDQYTMK